MPSSTTFASLDLSKNKILSEIPHSRRQYVPDSSDDSGHLTVQHYIYRRDHYRSTSLALLLPLPMIVTEASEDLRNRYEADDGLRMAISQILDAHDIRAPCISLEAQAKPGYPDGDASIPVLQVFVDTDEASDSTTRWCTARREITALLDDHGFQELEVDIYDPKRYYQSSIFPIHPSHPAVALFNSVQDELIKLVCTRIKSAWDLFSLFQVGLADNVERPAVVLMVAPLAEHDWASLKASLEEIIAGMEIGDQSGLRVEIMPGWTP